MARFWRQALFLAAIAGLALSSLNMEPVHGQPETRSAPQIISTFPAQREVVGPGSAIRLSFDQPMNRASVEAALTFDPPLNGTLAWADDSTLTFTPAAPLQRGAEYRVQIGEGAQSAAGISLEERFRLIFQITPNLSVSQAFPAPGASGVEAGTTISVVFDRPVVPLVTTGEQANLPQPLTFDPPVEGKGEWAGTAIYLFRPSKALAGGTLYTATVSGDLKDVDGSPISAPYTWQFRTIEPQLLNIWPNNGATQITLKPEIRVDFNQPMDIGSLREAFALRSSNSGANVAGALTLENDGATLVFKPASPLEHGVTYLISVLGSARSASGQAALTNPQSSTFTTVPLPRVVRSFPANGQRVDPGRGVQIEYNAPMDRESFKGKVRVEPKPDKLEIYPSGSYLYINFLSLPATTYTVTIDAGVADPYGNTVNEPFTLTFSTGDLSPSLDIARRDYQIAFTSAYRPDTTVLAASVNISQIDARLAALEIPELLGIATEWGNVDLYRYEPPRITRRWTQKVEAGKNQRAEFAIKLAGDDGGQLAPGVYYADYTAPEFLRFLQPPLQEPIKQIIIVATANLIIKQTPDDMLVWATDLKSGQPLPNVQITVYGAARQVVGSGLTDASGLARIGSTGVEAGYWVVAAGSGAFSLTHTRWRNDDFEPYAFDSFGDYQPVKLVTYLYTDQPIYRPGRPMYFRGIVRNQDDVTFTVPAGEPIQVTIYDQNGKELYNQSLTLNNYGAFSGKIDLAQDAVLGSYSLQTKFRGQDAYLSFQVAEFRPPEFLVTAAAEKSEVAAGELIKVTVDGKFLFGGPVSGARVDWVAVANQAFFPIPLPYEFGPDLGFGFGRRPGWVYNRQVGGGTGTLDAKGQFVIELPADLGDFPVRQEFTIEATVTDITNQSISGRVNVTVHPATIYVGLQPENYIGKSGEPFNTAVTIVDWAGKPQPNRTVTVKAIETRWEQDPNTLEWKQQRTIIDEKRLTTNSEGKATFTFTPPRAGTYVVEGTARDERERIAQTTVSIWVSGRGAFSNRDEKRITLVPDKKGEYQPGETARILIPSPFSEPVKALITVERAKIMKTEIVEITGSYTYELPLDTIHAPNVFVAVSIVRGSGAQGASAEGGSIVPDMRYGLVNLSVKVKRQLTITITPSTRLAEPGKEVRFDVLTTDLDGKPVAAEVGLSLTDLATLSVGVPNSGRLFDSFWSTRGLSIVTSSPLIKIIDDLLAKDIYLRQQVLMEAAAAAAPQATQTAGLSRSGVGGEPPAPGQPMGGDAKTARDGQIAAPAPRTNFVDTPLWLPDLVTGEDGTAQAAVTLPDNLTTWRLDARAISKETHVGDASLDIVSTKPLLVRPATPRFFVVGDEVELAMVVNNNTDSDLAVNVALEAKGVSLRADGRQTVNIPKQGRTRITWLATVQDVRTVDLAFSAVSADGQYSDASKPAVGIGDERLLPVYRYLAPDYVATAGTLRQPGQRTEGILVPSEALAPTGELTVSLSPSLAAVTLDGLDYLRNFPYQCIEQTISRFLPNIITYRALQKLGLDKPELRAQLEAAATFALNKLKAEQKPDGGWGWYSLDESNLLTTTYAAWALVEAREADLRVDPEMLNRALGFIFSKLMPVSDGTPAYELNRTAFVLFVLARTKNPNVQYMDDLFRRREKMNLDARAFLIQAYALSRDALGFQDRIDALLADVNTRAIISATGIHWEEDRRDWWNWGSNTRTTAIVLDTLVKLTPQSELIPNVVRWLMVARRGDAWETTQETAWAVMALTNWMDVSGELRASYEFVVRLNEKQIGEGKASAETLRDTTTLKVSVAEMLREQVNRLSFSHGEGEGALYYTATLHVNQPVEKIAPTNRGFGFNRTYLIDGKPVTEARVGDVITVSLEITLNNDVYYVIINDPIPAGTEAIDRSLQTTSQIGQRPDLSLLDPYDPWGRGWGWWWFSHTELRSEKVVLSAPYLPRGTYKYVYQVQATTPGVYRVIPPNGNEFYFPEVFGRGAGSLFTIRP